jgi:GT2 family glycosyltransferase
MTRVVAIGDDPAERTALRQALRLHAVVFGQDPDAATLVRYAERRRAGETLAGLAASLLGTAGLDDTAAIARYRERFGSAPAPTLERTIEGDPTIAAQRLMPILFPGGTSPGHGSHYRWWIEENDTLSDADRARIRVRIDALPRRPRLSFVVPMREVTGGTRADTLRSLTAQLYPDIEIVVVAPARTGDAPRAPNLRVVAASGRRTMAELFNAGLAACTGDFVGLVEDGDALFETAAFEAAAAIAAEPALRILYSDEDSIHADGRRHRPILKTDWDPDAMLAQDQTGRLALFDAALVRELGGLRANAGSWAEYDLMLRASRTAAPQQIKHLLAILYHRRTPSVPWWSRLKIGARAPARDALVREHLAALGAVGCAVSSTGSSGRPGNPLRITHPLPAAPPMVSVVIPTKDRLDLLRPCLDGLLRKTDYPALEALIVDNDSREAATRAYLAGLTDARVRVLEDPGPFNWSAINNRAVAAARGDVVLLLNNDIEIIRPDWLRELVVHALRPEVGVVGAKLLFPDGRIQHAGMAVGPDHGPTSHPWTHAAGDEPGYLNCLAITHNVSAVTGACLAMRKSVFDELGGFDAVNLAVGGSDPDLCLRARARGYRVIWTPHACLVHNESATRGRDDGPRAERFRREQAHLRTTWSPALAGDPFLNANLSRFAAAPLMVPRSPVVRPWQEPA